MIQEERIHKVQRDIILLFGMALFAAFAMMLSSCSLLQKHIDEKAKAEEIARMDRAQKEELLHMQKTFEDGRFENALAESMVFQTNHPISNYTYAARLVQGKSFFKTEQMDSSEKVLRDLIKSSRSENPEIAAECFYWLGNIYLSKSQDSLAIAAFLDANNLKESLPAEIQLADLPVRLAVLSARNSDWVKAQAYLKEAEIGIAQLVRARPDVNAKWIAQLYLRMGQATYVVPDIESYSIAVKTMRVSQVQLLRAMALSAEPYSADALATLIQAYDDFWNVSQSYQAPTGLDPIIRVKMQKQARQAMTVQYLELIKDLKLWFPFADQAKNQLQEDFQSFVGFKEELAFRAIHKDPFDTNLTKNLEVSPLQKSPAKINSQLKSEDPNN